MKGFLMNNRWSLAGLCAASILAANAAMAAAPSPPLKQTMRDIYRSVEILLPLSIQEYNPGNQADLVLAESHLKRLEDQLDVLEKHSSKRTGDPGFAFIGDSLVRDIRNARHLFKAGRYPESAFMVRHMVENCVSCHTRVAGAGDAGFASGLMKKLDTRYLELPDIALLQTATRQFDAAMDTREKIIREAAEGRRIVPVRPFIEYLTLALRVKKDPARARRTLEEVTRSAHLPAFVMDDIRGWVKDLKDPALKPSGKRSSLDEARRIMEKGQALIEYPTDRRGVVHYIMASGHLIDNLQKPNISKEETAETCYLLGVTELIVGRSFWLSQADLYFEASIRADPKGLRARKAFRLLEENIVTGFTGSSGTHIPRDVQARLNELADLIGEKRRI